MDTQNYLKSQLLNLLIVMYISATFLYMYTNIKEILQNEIKL